MYKNVSFHYRPIYNSTDLEILQEVNGVDRRMATCTLESDAENLVEGLNLLLQKERKL